MRKSRSAIVDGCRVTPSGSRRAPSAEGQIPHLIGPVVGGAALHDEQEVFDHLRHGQRLRDGDHAGHRVAGPDPVIGAGDQRGQVMRQHHPPFRGGPSQHRLVAGTAKAEVLDAYEIGQGWRRRSPRTRSLLKSSSTKNRVTPAPTRISEPAVARGCRREDSSLRSCLLPSRPPRDGESCTRPPLDGGRARKR